jgi:hypothetical protein
MGARGGRGLAAAAPALEALAERLTTRGEYGDGHQYKKRHPLGVLGLSFLSLGVYFFVWYYKINDELRRAENDQGISPTRSLMAMIFGWLIIVPPFIAMDNTAKHVQSLETRRGVGQTVEPSLTVALMLLVSLPTARTSRTTWTVRGATTAARAPAAPDPGQPSQEIDRAVTRGGGHCRRWTAAWP